MKETLEHKQAFDFYYTLGKSRSLPQVGHEYNVSLNAVKKWSKAFQWQKRIQNRDKKIAKQLEKVTDQSIVEIKGRYSRVAEVMLEKIVTVKNGKIIDVKLQIETISDFEKVVKILLLLLGEPTERVDLTDEERARKVQELLKKAKSRKKSDTGKSKTK